MQKMNRRVAFGAVALGAATPLAMGGSSHGSQRCCRYCTLEVVPLPGKLFYVRVGDTYYGPGAWNNIPVLSYTIYLKNQTAGGGVSVHQKIAFEAPWDHHRLIICRPDMIDPCKAPTFRVEQLDECICGHPYKVTCVVPTAAGMKALTDGGCTLSCGEFGPGECADCGTGMLECCPDRGGFPSPIPIPTPAPPPPMP